MGGRDRHGADLIIGTNIIHHTALIAYRIDWFLTHQRRNSVSCSARALPWAKPARAAGTRVAGSIWFVPIAARESASGVITSTRLP